MRSFKGSSRSHSKTLVVWLLRARAGCHVLAGFLCESCLFLISPVVWTSGVRRFGFPSGREAVAPLLICGETPRCQSHVVLGGKQKFWKSDRSTCRSHVSHRPAFCLWKSSLISRGFSELIPRLSLMGVLAPTGRVRSTTHTGTQPTHGTLLWPEEAKLRVSLNVI